MQQKFLMLGPVFEIHPHINNIPGMLQIEFLRSLKRYSRVICQKGIVFLTNKNEILDFNE